VIQVGMALNFVKTALFTLHL